MARFGLGGDTVAGENDADKSVMDVSSALPPSVRSITVELNTSLVVFTANDDDEDEEDEDEEEDDCCDAWPT